MLKLISQVDLTTFSGHHKPSNAPAASSAALTQQNSVNGGAASVSGGGGEHGASRGHHHQQFEVFEGNIEEQARILCKQFMKREILDHLPAPERKDEESDADNANDNDNAASMEVEDLAGGEPPAAVPVENGITGGAAATTAKSAEEKGAERQTTERQTASASSTNAAANNGQKGSAGLEVIKASSQTQP